MQNTNKIYWVIGQMCAGKTYYSEVIGKCLDLKPFHLDNIRQDISLVDAYKEAIKTGLIEGFTPHRNPQHLSAIMQAIASSGIDEIIYILIAPSYEQWKENCKPVIACPTDENPPNYTEEEYYKENERLMQLNPKVIIK